jgi:hypothetical protein
MLLLSALVLTACSGSDPKSLTQAGYDALGRGDEVAALSKFDSALEGLEPAHPGYLRAVLGRCSALAKSDPLRARVSFLDVARAVPDQVTEDDYGFLCDMLIRAEAGVEAVEVMHAGMGHFPGSAKMQAIHDAVWDAANRAKTPDALRRFADLGYTGTGATR